MRRNARPHSACDAFYLLHDCGANASPGGLRRDVAGAQLAIRNDEAADADNVSIDLGDKPNLAIGVDQKALDALCRHRKRRPMLIASDG